MHIVAKIDTFTMQAAPISTFGGRLPVDSLQITERTDNEAVRARAAPPDKTLIKTSGTGSSCGR
jgi:hypothetical protein